MAFKDLFLCHLIKRVRRIDFVNTIHSHYLLLANKIVIPQWLPTCKCWHLILLEARRQQLSCLRSGGDWKFIIENSIQMCSFGYTKKRCCRDNPAFCCRQPRLDFKQRPRFTSQRRFPRKIILSFTQVLLKEHLYKLPGDWRAVSDVCRN